MRKTHEILLSIINLLAGLCIGLCLADIFVLSNCKDQLTYNQAYFFIIVSLFIFLVVNNYLNVGDDKEG